MARGKSVDTMNGSSATVGYEAKLWPMSDALRDTVLPKLIGGDVRVRDSDRLEESAE